MRELVGQLSAAERDLELVLGPCADAVLDAQGNAHLLGNAQSALRESEECFRSTYEQAAVGIAHISLAGRFIRMNDKFLDIVGAELDEKGARSFAGRLAQEELASGKEARRDLLSGTMPSHSTERRYVSSRGTVVWANVITALERSVNGKPKYFTSIYQDITQRKMAEEKLQASQTLVRMAGRLGQLGGWSVELPAVHLNYSDEVCSLHGMPNGFAPTVDEAIQFCAPEYRESMARAFWDCVNQGTSFDVELQITTATGKRLWVRSICEAERDTSGVIRRIHGAMQDITDQKRAEASAIRLATLVEFSDDAIIGKDLQGVIQSWNRGAEKIFGYTASEMVGTPAGQLVPAHLRDITTKIWARIRDGGVAERFETQRLTKAGRLIDVAITASPIIGPPDKIIGTSAVIRDITERKQAERTMLQQQSEFRTLFDLIPARIWLKDNENRILQVNKLGAEAVGKSVEEIEGRNSSDMYPVETAKYHAEDLEVIRSGQPKLAIVEMLTDGAGHEKWMKTDKVPIRGKDGKVHGIIVVTQDITRLKESDRELHRQRMELQALFDLIPAMILFKDTANKVLRVNQRFATSIGKRVDEIEGKPMNEIFPETAAKRYMDDLDVIRSGAPKLGLVDSHLDRAGKLRWFQTDKVPCFDGAGKVTGIIVLSQDITERRRIEEALRESEERFRELFAAAATGIAVSTTEGRYLQANPAYCRMLGYSEEELMERNFASITHPDDLHANIDLRDRLLAGQMDNFVMEKRYVKKNGDILWCRTSVAATHDKTGKVETLIVVAEDVTERNKAQQSLVLFRTLIHRLDVAISIIDPETRMYLDVNENACSSTGYSREELLSLSVSGIDPFLTPSQQERIKKALSTEGAISFESRQIRKDGTTFPVEVSLKRVQVDKTYNVAVVRDITQRRRDEARMRRLVDSNMQGIFFWNTDGRVTGGNDAFLSVVGYTREDLESGRISWSEMTPPEYALHDKRALSQIAATGLCDPYEKEWVRKDGSRVPILIGATIIEDTPGDGVCFVIDRTEHTKSEDALRASEKRFKALFDQAAVGVAQIDAVTGRYLHANQRFNEIMGLGLKELPELTATDITHPETVGRDLGLVRPANSAAKREFTFERRIPSKNGSEVWANFTVSEMWAAGEKPDYYMAIVQDITARKQLEEQFRQAQKMEAIGTLAGGIAHDFNNILAAIIGYSQLAEIKLNELKVDGGSEVRDYIGSVLKAGNRAAELVKQILTFSRQEPSERKSINLLPVVTECVKLLRATTPATIEYDIDLAGDSPTVLADASQVHQIMLNLGTNALHAMKDRPGRLGIKLERCTVDEAHVAMKPKLRPGLFARISVSDNGCGMDKETMERIFEPFFTTKPAGEGTGLGLAVVHGIMDSHDGAVIVYSQPGEGTVFRLYFPAHAIEASAAAADDAPVPRGRGERILFVDDEELLVSLGERMLTGLGYTVETTRLPESALALVRADPFRFSLVITDHTMPSMTGLALANKLRQTRPNLPIILMTGYDGSFAPERVEAAGIRQLIIKPTSIQSLGVAVRDALAANPRLNNGSNPPDR